MRISLRGESPRLVAIAGPNGAGKSTFHSAHLAEIGLPFVNADVIAREIGIGAYEAAAMAEEVRRQLFERRESFVFETVFSDPVGGKLGFLQVAVAAGYEVVLCFIGVSSASLSEERVAMRVLEGGHDVPADKITSRYPRTMENLRLAMQRLPLILIYDNDDLRQPHRFVAQTRDGKVVDVVEPVPVWLQLLLP